jgi:hypothetical protein
MAQRQTRRGTRPSVWEAETCESLQRHQATSEIDVVSQPIAPSLVSQRFTVPVDVLSTEDDEYAVLLIAANYEATPVGEKLSS